MNQSLLQYALAGQGYIGATAAAGVVIPAGNSTSPVFGIWNPSGSGVNAVLNTLNMGVTTVGTEAVAALGLFQVANAGSAIGTGAPLSAFNAGTPVNSVLGEGKASRIRFTPAGTNTLTTAGTLFYGLPWSMPAADATLGGPFSVLQHDFNGAVIVPEGVFVYIAGNSNTAIGLTMDATLTWVEIPA